MADCWVAESVVLKADHLAVPRAEQSADATVVCLVAYWAVCSAVQLVACWAEWTADWSVAEWAVLRADH